MKKIIFALILVTAGALAIAQDTMYVYTTGGLSKFPVSQIDSITFVNNAKTTGTGNPGVVTVSSLRSDTLGKGYTQFGTAQHIKGTLLAGITYYLAGNIYVPTGDTLIVQPGVTLICLGGTPAVSSPYNITVRGVLISEGTQAAPISFTVPDAEKAINAGYGGAWGGIDADTAQNLTLKWTKIEYVGSPDQFGSPRLGVAVEYASVLDVEDSWIRFTYDDGLRIHSVKNCIVRRNTFEHCGALGAESINIKQGATGDISYNIIWNSATKAIKLETDATVSFPQTSFNIYNNTIINSGFRNYAKPGPGISIDLYTWANVWNNLTINCLRGFMEFSGADTTDSRYNYNGYFCTNTAVDSAGFPGAVYFVERLDYEYYTNYLPQFPPVLSIVGSVQKGDGPGVVGKPQKYDLFIPVASAATQTVVNRMNEYTVDVPMLDWERTGGSGISPYDVSLTAGSPAIGAGISSIPSYFTDGKGISYTYQWPTYQNQSNSLTPITPTPSADLGAKPTTGSYGNLH